VHNGNPYETEHFNNGNSSWTELDITETSRLRKTCIVPGIRTSSTGTKRKLHATEKFGFRAVSLQAGFTVYSFDIFDACLSVHSSAQVELLYEFLWYLILREFRQHLLMFCTFVSNCITIADTLRADLHTFLRTNICYRSSRKKCCILLCTLTLCCRWYSHKINNLYYSIYSACLIYPEDGNCNVCRSFGEYLVVWA